VRTTFENPKFFEDTYEFLDLAHKRGYQLCLSTGGRDSLKKVKTINKFFGKDYFDNFFIDEKLMNSLKSEKTYYQNALKHFSWKKDNVVSIGDSIETDIYPAKLVGIKTILVDRKNEEDLSDPKNTPNYKTNNLLSALNHLEATTTD
jgi:putative hydrolase of the HAD superfamily